jgi:hypothetical protein
MQELHLLPFPAGKSSRRIVQRLKRPILLVLIAQTSYSFLVVNDVVTELAKDKLVPIKLFMIYLDCCNVPVKFAAPAYPYRRKIRGTCLLATLIVQIADLRVIILRCIGHSDKMVLADSEGRKCKGKDGGELHGGWRVEKFG